MLQDRTIDSAAGYTLMENTTTMATAWKEQLTDSFEQAKTVGVSRWRVIYAILQETLPRLWTEITAGAKEIGGISSAAANVAKETLREEGKVKAATFQERFNQYVQQLVEQFKATAAERAEPLKEKALDWDIKLEARYGNNYKVARQTINHIVEAYKASQAQVAAEGGTVPTIEVSYQVVEDKAAQVGTTIAQQEMQTKQQIKDTVAAVMNQ
jgi:hypothetical protein